MLDEKPGAYEHADADDARERSEERTVFCSTHLYGVLP